MNILINNDYFTTREDVRIDLEDRGYQFGDGVYEVVRIYNGKPFQMDAHMRRFERSAKEIRLDLHTDINSIKDSLLKLLANSNLRDGIIYFQATRGVAPRNHAFPNNATSIFSAYTKEIARPLTELENGVKIVTTEDIRWLRCDIKSISLLGNVLAKQYSVENSAKEAVQIRNGIVTEGSASNFFIIKDGMIYTHKANNLILKGITRDQVEMFAKELEVPFIEKEFTLDEALTADEAFITSTTSEVTPVIQINDHLLSEKPGPVTKELQRLFTNLVNSFS